jgi:hypothetical protein
MNHPSDSQLNEYLDQTSDSPTRRAINSHIETCPDCRRRVEELQLVFSRLKEVSEVELSHDLTSSVLARLPHPQRLWTRAFAAQLGAALGISLYMLIQAAQVIHVPKLLIPEFRIPEFQFALPDLRFADLYHLLSVSHFSSLIFHLPTIDLQSVYLPFSGFPTLQLSTFNMIFILAGVFALGLIGNAILLQQCPGIRK